MYKVRKKEKIVDGVSQGVYYFVSNEKVSLYSVMCISESDWEQFKKVINEK